MKKLIIAAAVACVAVLTQAASVSWSVSGLKGSDGKDLTSGAAYVFCTKGTSATTVAAVTSAIEGLNAADLQTYLTGNSLSALKGTVTTAGYIGVSGVDLATSGVPEKTSAPTLFAVIVDDDSFGDSVKYVVTGVSNSVKTPGATTTNIANFNIPNTATLTPGNWTAAAPEPTSGLLLLLGVAGLALKRKRA